jgi:penicillin-binding protein 1A
VLLLLILAVAWIAVAAVRVMQLDPEAEWEAATLFDRNGEPIAVLGTKKQAFTPLADISVEMQQAIVAIEDSRFFLHPGFDLKGVARALWVDLKSRRRAQGASTITQQLVRVLYLSPEKTIQRKLSEILLAVLLEMRFSKARILEIYLNTIYYGEGAYGIADAALTYFGKQPSELTLAEAALLAGLPKAPSTLSPYRNPDGALARRDLVLERMAELGYITSQQAAVAKEEPLKLAGLRGGLAPYFVDYVASQLIDTYGATAVHRGGLRVHTTLDLRMQKAARDALGQTQGAIVAIDVRDGAIRSMVGGRDYVESQFNRATQAVRQPGSAFKPFVYAVALEKGLPMNYILIDHPGDFNGYRPENFKGEYWGTVTLKFALTRSLNTASVRLLRQVGVDAAIEMAQRLGISTLLLPDDRNLALVLGGLTKGVTPLEMTAAYAVFANGGFYNKPYAIEKVYDRRGRLIFRHRAQPRRVLSEEVAYMMTNMLQAVVEYGTGTAANIGRPQAGKTGTTNNTLSAWFVGYTPQLAATVYVGHDTRQPLNMGGGSLAAPIWGKFALNALSDEPVLGFPVPTGIQTNVPIDPFTGKIAGAKCALQERAAFLPGTAPTQFAPCYWNADAQPRPYRVGTDDPPQALTHWPGGLFGDDPMSFPASLLYPLDVIEAPASPPLPFESRSSPPPEESSRSEIPTPLVPRAVSPPEAPQVTRLRPRPTVEERASEAVAVADIVVDASDNVIETTVTDDDDLQTDSADEESGAAKEDDDGNDDNDPEESEKSDL